MIEALLVWWSVVEADVTQQARAAAASTVAYAVEQPSKVNEEEPPLVPIDRGQAGITPWLPFKDAYLEDSSKQPSRH